MSQTPTPETPSIKKQPEFTTTVDQKKLRYIKPIQIAPKKAEA
jgi:hypothetical protein